MHFTTQSKKSAGVLSLKQIILAFALLIVLTGQISAIPVPDITQYNGTFTGEEGGLIPNSSS